MISPLIIHSWTFDRDGIEIRCPWTAQVWRLDCTSSKYLNCCLLKLSRRTPTKYTHHMYGQFAESSALLLLLKCCHHIYAITQRRSSCITSWAQSFLLNMNLHTLNFNTSRGNYLERPTPMSHLHLKVHKIITWRIIYRFFRRCSFASPFPARRQQRFCT
jgi:fucose 4-O-acetylase-like acetyltransferase